MKKLGKILIGILLALIFIGGCAMAGLWKAKQNSATSKSTSTSNKLTKAKNKTNTDKTTSVSTSYQKKTTSTKNNDENFINTPWTTQSALDFLQKVNDSSDEGRRVVDEADAKYLEPTANYGNFPGNSIFLFENNRSGAGDGGVVLTKNRNHTVTLTMGEGAGSSPFEKVIVDADTYQVLSQKGIHVQQQQSMWEYFGISVPRNSDDNHSDSQNNSNDDANYDATVQSDSQSDSNNDSNSDNNDNQSDSNNTNSQNTDTNQNQNTDSDN